MINHATSSSIYQQYTYNYPHKHAYRTIETPISIKKAWQNEDTSNLFAYLHIPFCEMRCGFCNLFTISNPKKGVGQYLEALQREAATYRTTIPKIRFEEYAIGGGTPTFLSEPELEKMLSIFKNILEVDTQNKYGSIEASPKSITPEKLNLIESYGINRISMGIQSWIESETKLLGRPQSIKEVKRAIDNIKGSKIPEVNLDLIYGIYTQTKDSWLYSLEKTVDYQPTEIFLYPLYTRPLTGLNKMQKNTADNRLKLYRFGRDFLKKKGYKQLSMRCFKKENTPIISNKYRSTSDGMIGIGAGARSYTTDLHYSTNYAVSRKATKAIIHDYSLKTNFEWIDYGFYMNLEEKWRRFLVKSLIDGGKLNPEEFTRQFDESVFNLPIIQELMGKKCLEEKDGFVQLTEIGMEMEDMIGPLFFSENVKALMQTFELS